jgi:hypothetical protein
MEAVHKKRGPVPQGLEDTRVKVQGYLLEWAKQKEGGFSALVRSLLKREYDKEQKRTLAGS